MEIEIIDNLESTRTDAGLAANQGRILDEKIGNLDNLNTEAKNNAVSAINEVKTQLQEIITALDEINGEVI